MGYLLFFPECSFHSSPSHFSLYPSSLLSYSNLHNLRTGTNLLPLIPNSYTPTFRSKLNIPKPSIFQSHVFNTSNILPPLQIFQHPSNYPIQPPTTNHFSHNTRAPGLPHLVGQKFLNAIQPLNNDWKLVAPSCGVG